MDLILMRAPWNISEGGFSRIKSPSAPRRSSFSSLQSRRLRSQRPSSSQRQENNKLHTHLHQAAVWGPEGTVESLTTAARRNVGRDNAQASSSQSKQLLAPRTCLGLACVTVLDEVTDPECAGSESLTELCCCRLEVCKDPVRGRAGQFLETLALLYRTYQLSEPYFFFLLLGLHVCVSSIP